MSALFQSDFYDLHIGEKLSRVTNLDGAAGIRPTPPEWDNELAGIRAQCDAIRKTMDHPEFRLTYGERFFRVTTIVDIDGHVVYILRRREPNVLPFDSLGYPKAVRDELMRKNLKGVVLFGGPMAAGKTESAASLLIARMNAYGEFVYAAEDPQETNLNGSHGLGHCYQVPVSRTTGSLEDHLVRGVRTGADAIYIGEIRRGADAYQAALAGINGALIVSTTHGSSVPEVIERVCTLACERHPHANALIADGLAMVIWQTLEVMHLPHSPEKRRTLLRSEFLSFTDNDAARGRIKSGDFAGLQTDVEMQRSNLQWRTDGVR